MSLSKQKRLEQKKVTILDEAKKVLIRSGKNATMGDIAQALDMDKSSLYYYFKGIPEILNTILDKEYYDFSVDIHRIRRDSSRHCDVLGSLVRLILEFYHDNLEIVEIILNRVFPLFLDRDSGEESSAINSYMESYRLANELMLEEIALSLEAGEMDTIFSPDMILKILRGAIFGVCAGWGMEEPPIEKAAAITVELLRMFCGDKL